MPVFDVLALQAFLDQDAVLPVQAANVGRGPGWLEVDAADPFIVAVACLESTREGLLRRKFFTIDHGEVVQAGDMAELARVLRRLAKVGKGAHALQPGDVRRGVAPSVRPGLQ